MIAAPRWRNASAVSTAASPRDGVRAPGRAELLGTDTDDHLGYVLTMSIHLDTWIAFKPADGPRVRLHSMNLDRDATYRAGAEPVDVAAEWDHYVSGVSRALAADHPPARR